MNKTCGLSAGSQKGGARCSRPEKDPGRLSDVLLGGGDEQRPSHPSVNVKMRRDECLMELGKRSNTYHRVSSNVKISNKS